MSTDNERAIAELYGVKNGVPRARIDKKKGNLVCRVLGSLFMCNCAEGHPNQSSSLCMKWLTASLMSSATVIDVCRLSGLIGHRSAYILHRARFLPSIMILKVLACVSRSWYTHVYVPTYVEKWSTSPWGFWKCLVRRAVGGTNRMAHVSHFLGLRLRYGRDLDFMV